MAFSSRMLISVEIELGTLVFLKQPQRCHRYAICQMFHIRKFQASQNDTELRCFFIDGGNVLPPLGKALLYVVDHLPFQYPLELCTSSSSVTIQMCCAFCFRTVHFNSPIGRRTSRAVVQARCVFLSSTVHLSSLAGCCVPGAALPSLVPALDQT